MFQNLNRTGEKSIYGGSIDLSLWGFIFFPALLRGLPFIPTELYLFLLCFMIHKDQFKISFYF